MHPNSGNLYVLGEPDAEKINKYQLTVQISNGQATKSTQVKYLIDFYCNVNWVIKLTKNKFSV